MKTILPYIIIAVVIMTGCRRSEAENELCEEGRDTQMSIVIGDPGEWNPITRGYELTPSQEQQIKSLEVLIFNSAQRLVSRTRIDNPTTMTNTIHTKSGSGMSVYVVTNSSLLINSSATPNDVLGNVTTVAQLKNIKITNLFTHISSNQSLPMCGAIENVTVNPTGPNTLTVPLNYVAAKITVNLRSSLPVGESFVLDDWKLASLARYTYLFPRSVDVVDVAQDNDFVTQSSTNTWSDGTIDVAGVATPVKTTTFYIFENRRGVTSNTDARLKSGTTAPARATRMVAKGYYQKSTGTTGVNINLMFGANSVNDYNIERTKQYVYNINITGLDEYNIDTRYTLFNTGFQAEVMNTTLDAHYDFRPLRVSAFQGVSKVEILDENDNLTTSSFWLKVSTRDITKFVNVSGTYVRPTYNPTTEMLQSLNVLHTNPTTMQSQMVYLYADEFLTDAATRTAKIRITYTPTNSTAQPPTVVTIRQRGILLAGNVGLRTINSANSLNSTQYRLGIELVEEATLSITPGNMNNERTISMQWGFKDKSMISRNNYGFRNGFENTKKLVFSNETQGTLRAPYGRTGENTISYQYYDPIYNTYAARYCFEKNRDTNGDGVISGTEIKWYLPSAEEQLLVFVANESWSSVVSERWENSEYLTSSQSAEDKCVKIYYTNGAMSGTDNRTELNVRCVRQM